MNPITYKLILASLERELAEIDIDLERMEKRRAAMAHRRVEVIVGMNEIRRIMDERKGGLDD